MGQLKILFSKACFRKHVVLAVKADSLCMIEKSLIEKSLSKMEEMSGNSRACLGQGNG